MDECCVQPATDNLTTSAAVAARPHSTLGCPILADS